MQQLFNGQTTNGASGTFGHFEGKKFLNVYVSGVLDGATVQIEAQTPGGATFIPLNGGDITEARMFTIEAAPFVGRLELINAGVNTSVSAWVEEDTIAAEQRVTTALGA